MIHSKSTSLGNHALLWGVLMPLAVVVSGFSAPTSALAGTPVGCESGSRFEDYIAERGCNATVDGQFIWFPSLKAYRVFVQELKLFKARR